MRRPVVTMSVSHPRLSDVALSMRGQVRFLAGLLAASFFFTGLRHRTGFMVVEPWHFVAVLCFAAWIVELLQEGRFTLELDMVGVGGLFIVAAAWLALFGALDVMTWFKRAMRITCLFGVYLFLVRHLRDEQEILGWLRVSLWACALAAFFVIEQALEWIQRGAQLEVLLGKRFAGTFSNANEGSTYIAMAAVLMLPLWRRVTGESRTSRFVFFALIGISSLAVLLGQSRSALIALVLGSAIVALAGGRGGLVAGTSALAGIGLWMWLSPAYLTARWWGTFGASDSSELNAFMQGGAVMRKVLAEMYWEVIKAHPIFGIGGANYIFMERLPLHWPSVPPGALAGYETIERYFGLSSHNGFLNWWAETGTVGLLAFIGTLGVTIWALCGMCIGKGMDDGRRELAAGTLAAVCVFIVVNLTGDFGVSEARYWLLLAIASIVLRLPAPVRAGAPGKHASP